MKTAVKFLSLALPIISLLAGCSGGLIGTSTGPEDGTNIIVKPGLLKLSPRMPLSLLDSEAKSLQASQSPSINDSEQQVGNKFTVNGVTVFLTNIKASNGIIHVIDSVLLPSADGSAVVSTPVTGATPVQTPSAPTQVAGQLNIVDTLAADSNSFRTLSNALELTGLDATLSGAGSFTLFAPTEKAFAALSDETFTALVSNIGSGQLRDILLYHVISGQAIDTSAAFGLSSQPLVTANGDSVVLRSKAQSWQLLSPVINDIETKRLNLHEELFLLDSVFEQVSSFCSEPDQSDCTIPAGFVEAIYTQEIVDQLNDQVIPEGTQSRSVFEQDWQNHLEASIGSNFSFGEISYEAREDGRFSLTLAPMMLSVSHKLTIDWTPELDDIRYRLTSLSDDEDESVYRYFNQPESERLTLRRTRAQQAVVSLDMRAGLLEHGSYQFSANVHDITMIGQANAEQARVSSLTKNDIVTDVTEESFYVDGIVHEGEVCMYTTDASVCDGALLFAHYYEDDFSEAIYPSGEISRRYPKLTVRDLPDYVTAFYIRPEDVSLRYLPTFYYCSGFQEASIGFIDIICSVDIDTALSGVVEFFDDFGNTIALDDVEIMLIE